MSNLVVSIYSKNDLEYLKSIKIHEVLINLQTLSVLGKITDSEVQEVIDWCYENDIRPVLNWNTLPTQDELEEQILVFNNINKEKIQAIRVKNLGIGYFLQKKHPQLKLQLDLESYGHNLELYQKLHQVFIDTIERISVSVELTYEEIKQIGCQLNCELEILVHGMLPIFYSPRKLVSPLMGEDKAIGNSEESPHKNFPLRESAFGTIMFHNRVHCLLGKLPEVKTTATTHHRFDFNHLQKKHWIQTIIQLYLDFDENLYNSFKNSYGYKLTQGYFLKNNSRGIFKHLKNKHLKRNSKNLIGEVVAVSKGEYISFISTVTTNVKFLNYVKIYTPENKIKKIRIEFIKDFEFNDISTLQKDKLCFINYSSGITPKSLITYIEE